MSAAQHSLDQARSLARIAALEADPTVYVEQLAAELPGAATLVELEARDAALVAALGQIDAMIARAMRIRLDHALANDTSIGAPTRSVFASTITGYAGRLSLLGARSTSSSRSRTRTRCGSGYAMAFRSRTGRSRRGCAGQTTSTS
ncbi:MAG TPA: hypothetical protein VF516_14895 [Kofleriaceae bacterium]